MDDGTLLTPDRPALALDSTILRRALFGIAPTPPPAGEPVSSSGYGSACQKWSKPLTGDYLIGDVAGSRASYATLAAAQVLSTCLLDFHWEIHHEL